MSNFPYDRRFVYPDAEQARKALESQEARINLVVSWLMQRGAPKGAEVSIDCDESPSPTERVQWCMLSLNFNAADDEGAAVFIKLNLYLALHRPDIALVDIARSMGKDEPTPANPRRRVLSKRITLQRWIEPDPGGLLPPVPRPFGPHIDQFDPACMLSNCSDQFMEGALWTEPDETLWQKEKAYRGFVSYYRWRQISTV